jgi:hypothetical protein
MTVDEHLQQIEMNDGAAEDRDEGRDQTASRGPALQFNSIVSTTRRRRLRLRAQAGGSDLIAWRLVLSNADSFAKWVKVFGGVRYVVWMTTIFSSVISRMA